MHGRPAGRARQATLNLLLGVPSPAAPPPRRTTRAVAEADHLDGLEGSFFTSLRLGGEREGAIDSHVPAASANARKVGRPGRHDGGFATAGEDSLEAALAASEAEAETQAQLDAAIAASMSLAQVDAIEDEPSLDHAGAGAEAGGEVQLDVSCQAFPRVDNYSTRFPSPYPLTLPSTPSHPLSTRCSCRCLHWQITYIDHRHILSMPPSATLGELKGRLEALTGAVLSTYLALYIACRPLVSSSAISMRL